MPKLCIWTLKHEQQNHIDHLCVFAEFGSSAFFVDVCCLEHDLDALSSLLGSGFWIFWNSGRQSVALRGFGVWLPVLGWNLANARIFICSFGIVLYLGIFHLQFWDGVFWTEYFSPTFFSCSFAMAPFELNIFCPEIFYLQFWGGTWSYEFLFAIFSLAVFGWDLASARFCAIQDISPAVLGWCLLGWIFSLTVFSPAVLGWNLAANARFGLKTSRMPMRGKFKCSFRCILIFFARLVKLLFFMAARIYFQIFEQYVVFVQTKCITKLAQGMRCLWSDRNITMPGHHFSWPDWSTKFAGSPCLWPDRDSNFAGPPCL